jgi:hypothetical protein
MKALGKTTLPEANRLAGLNLVENRGEGQEKGMANAWQLTTRRAGRASHPAALSTRAKPISNNLSSGMRTVTRGDRPIATSHQFCRKMQEAATEPLARAA